MNTDIVIKHATQVSELMELHMLFDRVFEEENEGVTLAEAEVLVAREDICILVAHNSTNVVGGLVAYELPLLRGEKEYYLYDIAVDEAQQKQGIGTRLIEALKERARERGISTIFVDAEASDEGALTFYRSLKPCAGEAEVRHFTIKSGL